MALFISGQAYSEDTYKDRKKFVKDMNLQLTKEVSTNTGVGVGKIMNLNNNTNNQI